MVDLNWRRNAPFGPRVMPLLFVERPHLPFGNSSIILWCLGTVTFRSRVHYFY